MSDIASQRPGVNAWSPEFIENTYQEWKSDPSSVDPQWNSFFQGFELGAARDGSAVAPAASTASTDKALAVQSLVYHYRDIGHKMSSLDPLGRERKRPEELTLGFHGLVDADLDSTFKTDVTGLTGPQKLRDIIKRLESVYCSNQGIEYLHIQSTTEREWLQYRLEESRAQLDLTRDEKLHIMRKLHQAEIFETFLQKTYPGEKRFSLEGAETLIPMLITALDQGAERGAKEAVIGAAHRGRLNILASVMNKGYDDIFAEFEQNYKDTYLGGGDVKYHKGYSSEYLTMHEKSVYLTLAANPSHLETVDPVVMGRCRAKQRILGDTLRKQVLPIIVHGDAAFAGQGMVMETLQMMTLPGYSVGGVIHMIVNNQIGFTTDPISARSSYYCTDVAKTVQCPIFHVNGEDPELCARLVKLAVDYRQEFGKDVVLDMWCYRKYGHNEGDEPSYTQPRMYEIIRAKQPVRQIYSDQLVKSGVLDQVESDRMREAMEMILNEAHEHSRTNPAVPYLPGFTKKWGGMQKQHNFDTVKTGVDREKLVTYAKRLLEIPAGFSDNKKLSRILQKRYETVISGQGMEWGAAETLAYATLLAEGTPVRLSGQDSRRGTFTHRHSVLRDVVNEDQYIPLNNLVEGQARFCVYDSPLSEVSVLGFEYGYSITDPNMLIMWEAQFGDFANGAQVITDQYIASAEVKWDRYSGLVLLLPHGYEGQGPEHSSARMERFLQLCAEDNMQVVNVTTPAQYFHLMRRQMLRKFRKPLIVMTPKSLLRSPDATSTIDDLATGSFQDIIDDPNVENKKAVRRVLLCSGKVYYDLAARKKAVESTDTAIVRLEQIYPLHTKLLEQILGGYPAAKDVLWVQEEPRNMGAWTHINEALQEKMGIHPGYVGRVASATPAVGSKKLHDKELKAFLEAALPARPGAKVS
ncbi:2-oxoglutarate dehydrogenase E1 component [soil metagenome]